MALLVQKFGGTSVADPERIREVADQVARRVAQGDSIALVVSAMGKETDDLLHIADQVSSSQPGREMDMLITAGERKAIALVGMALADVGIEAESFTGSQAGFLTDGNHRNAKIVDIRPDRIREVLEAGKVAVVAGSQGVSPEKNVTFLGRGGSDTTAVGLAKALSADSCELFTDVSGVYSADPRIVPKAKKMSSITFDELLELTAAGCPKPALRSVELAHSWGVNLHVRSAFTWEIGTFVSDTEDPNMEQPIVKAVTSNSDVAKYTVHAVNDVPGQSATLFSALVDGGVNVDMIVQNVAPEGKTDISFTTTADDDVAVHEVLSEELLTVIGSEKMTSSLDVASVSIVGASMKSNPGVAATMFKTLAQNGINIQMISTSPIRISCLIDSDKSEDAVVKIHEAFGLGE